MVCPAEPGGLQYKFPRHPLVFKIMKRITDPWMGHAEVLVDIEQEDRHDPCLPVMAMDDIRVLVGLEHELKCGPAEKNKPLGVVFMPVKNAPVKKVLLGMGLYEKTFSAVDKPEEDRAVDRVVIKGDPEVIVNLSKAVDVVITHAIVFRQDDLNIIAPYFQFMRKPVYDIGEPSHLGNRRAFRRNHHDEHLFLLSCALIKLPMNTSLLS